MSSGGHSRRRRLDGAVAMVCLVAAVAIFLMFHELRHDDDFITYRYGLNLVEGNGLVFNPGQRVLGTTSPLFALVSAALYALVGKDLVPDAAVAVNAVALAVQAFLLYLLVRRALPVTAVALALLVLAGAAVPFTYLGLETHTYVALLLAAILTVQRGRPALGGVFTGLAFLARHDAALLVPLLLLRYRRPGDGRKGLRFLAAAAATVVPWLLFATVYYGWPVPRTLEAKRGLSTMGEYLGEYAGWFFVVPGLEPGAQVHALALALALLGLLVVVRHLRPLLPLPLFALALFLVYAWIGPPLKQSWHMYPATLAVRVLIVVGLLGFVEAGLRSAPVRRRRWRRVAACAIAAAWLVPVVHAAVKTGESLETGFWHGGRHDRYERVAAWTLDHAGPDRRLLAIEVGTLGYLTGYEMIDPFGLVTPTGGPAEDSAHIIALMREYRPDMVLMHAPWQGWFIETRTPYRTIHVFPWINPWSTLLIREPSVLLRPGELDELRSEMERSAAASGTDLRWQDLEAWEGAPPVGGER